MYSEDDEFSPYSSNSSKKLAFLFEKSNVTTGGNSSLMYKAPKQPRNQQHQDDHAKAVSSTSLRSQVHSSDSCLSLILLKVVQTFKLENNEYKSQGKLGAAILGNSNGNHYQLILYKEKTSVIAQAVLTSEFWFPVQPNNYTTFYDKHKILWSILFDGTACAIEFCTRVAVARWNCSNKHDTLMQDLVVMEGSKSVEEGSVLDISYTASLLVSSSKVEENIESIDKITVTVASRKDSSEKVWESKLIGMTEGSKRCIVLPASQSEKWKKYVRDNGDCGVLLVVHLDSIKSNKSDYLVTSDLNTSAEQSEKIKNESIKDAKTNSASSVRASLISRMAKMGQATLPFKTGARVPTASDSDETEEDGLSMESSDGMNKTCSTKTNFKQATQLSYYPDIPPSVPANQVMVNTDTTNTMGRLSTYGGNLVPSSSHVTATSYTSYIEPQLSLFISDLRSHNSELRNNINRITCKVEKVLEKVDSLDSIDKLLERLKSLDQKISQFPLMNQQNNENIGVARKDEKSILLQKTVNPLEILKKENTDLLLELSEISSKVNELQAKIIHLETIKLGLQNQLVKEKDSRNVMQKEHLCLMEKLNSQLLCHDSSIKNVQSSLDRLTEKVLPLENRIKEKSKFHFKSNEEGVKEIMKTVYENIQNKFTEDSKMYTTSEIHSALAEIIKLNTLEYLQNKTIDIKSKSSCESLPDSQKELNEQTCLTEISSERLKTDSNGTTDNDDKVYTCKSDETMTNGQEDAVLNYKDSLPSCERSIYNSDDKLRDVESSTSSVNDLADNMLSKNIEYKSSEDSVYSELESQKSEIKEKTKRDIEKCKELLEDTEKYQEVPEDSEKCSESRDQFPHNCVVNDNVDENWRSQPPPLSFDEEDKNTEDDWLKM